MKHHRIYIYLWIVLLIIGIFGAIEYVPINYLPTLMISIGIVLLIVAISYTIVHSGIIDPPVATAAPVDYDQHSLQELREIRNKRYNTILHGLKVRVDGSGEII